MASGCQVSQGDIDEFGGVEEHTRGSIVSKHS